jgi:hypothetical protein
LWTGVLVLVSLGNLVSIWFAARPGEPWHATIHGALALGFGLWAQRRLLREEKREPALTGVADDRLARIENSIDAVAVEVERIGEMERFSTALLSSKPPVKDSSPGMPEPGSVAKNVPK